MWCIQPIMARCVDVGSDLRDELAMGVIAAPLKRAAQSTAAPADQ
jgi:hypothetical protein